MTGRNLAIGAGVAIAAGLAFGLWARPDLGKDPTAAAERTAPPVPIEIGKPAPEALGSAGKLEVLSPDQAAAARANSAAPPAYIPAPPPPLPQVTGPSSQTSYGQPAPPPAIQQAPTRAGLDCSGARSPAEAMVCQDPDLAAADREMSRAYRRVLQSGAVPPGQVRADQRDWLSIREDAARHSRRAVAQIYQQRIDELNAMADGRDEGDGPGN
ncbi:lysozyme inhibitor LprI family protein [Phenylobacterium sp.]|uniref:lysozyme inhibitor LprI family protein n=1 Tax=Phenylobacterium sp. TaxID=1871053 RepID=UPI002DF6FECA|nr:lysozyme inhibitor LprI family protein [Phenylobacterium sp.]